MLCVLPSYRVSIPQNLWNCSANCKPGNLIFFARLYIACHRGSGVYTLSVRCFSFQPCQLRALCHQRTLIETPGIRHIPRRTCPGRKGEKLPRIRVDVRIAPRISQTSAQLIWSTSNTAYERFHS